MQTHLHNAFTSPRSKYNLLSTFAGETSRCQRESILNGRQDRAAESLQVLRAQIPWKFADTQYACAVVPHCCGVRAYCLQFLVGGAGHAIQLHC